MWQKKQNKTGSYRKHEQQQHGWFIATGQCCLTKEEHRMTVLLYFQPARVRIQCSSSHLPGFPKVPPQTRMESLNICAPITHFYKRTDGSAPLTIQSGLVSIYKYFRILFDSFGELHRFQSQENTAENVIFMRTESF